MMHRRRNSLFMLMLLCCCFANAQNFTIKASLQLVTANGFYSVNITPQISSYTKTDYSDLRITDDKEQFIPYIILSQQPSFLTHNYTRLLITKKDISDSGQSVVIIKNQAQQKISSLALLIRNAAVTRNATISGSDDSIHWFIISDNIDLEKQTVAETDRYIKPSIFQPALMLFLKLILITGKIIRLI